MALAEAVAAEAVKVVTAQLVGVGLRGGQRLVRMLRDKLGTLHDDPDELARRVVAAADTDPEWWARVASEVAAQNAVLASTYQAMPPVPFFDRAGPLAEAPESGVFVVGGQRGSGRTALARQLAYARREEFPLGVVEVDLDQHRDDGTLQPASAWAEVLRWLGVAGDDVANPSLALRQQYASVTVTRRFVLILRNARGVDEIEPFDTTPVNLVLVTTSDLTDSLRVRYANTQLGPLDRGDAWALLASRCGDVQLDAERAAAGQLLELCGFLPEAVGHVANALTRRAGEPAPVAGLLAHLRDSGVAGAFGPVRAALADTFAALSPDEQRAALLLTAHPAPGFTGQSAEALLGPGAWQLVQRLEDAGLLTEVGRDRRRLHGLAYDYLARQVEGDEAFDRMLAYCRDVAVAADERTHPNRLRRYPPAPAPSWQLPEGELLDWLDRERPVLLELARAAYRRGRHEEVCQLAGSLEVLVNARGGWHWCAALSGLATASAAQLADTACRARAHAMLGRACTQLHAFDRAGAELDRAWRLATALPDDRQLTASLHEFHGRYHQERGAPGRAVACFRDALAVDEQTGDGRAIGIHARMLANALLDPGSGAPLEEVDRYLTLAERHSEDRNLARVYMVRARARLVERRVDDAARQLAQAAGWASAEHWTSYREELEELRAALAYGRGDAVAAAATMGELVRHAMVTGHPKVYRYLTELERYRS